jgi:hypothetical protein
MKLKVEFFLILYRAWRNCLYASVGAGFDLPISLFICIFAVNYG